MQCLAIDFNDKNRLALTPRYLPGNFHQKGKGTKFAIKVRTNRSQQKLYSIEKRVSGFKGKGEGEESKEWGGAERNVSRSILCRQAC